MWDHNVAERRVKRALEPQRASAALMMPRGRNRAVSLTLVVPPGPGTSAAHCLWAKENQASVARSYTKGGASARSLDSAL